MVEPSSSKRCRIISGVIDEERPDCSPGKERNLCGRIVVLVGLVWLVVLVGLVTRTDPASNVGERKKERNYSGNSDL